MTLLRESGVEHACERTTERRATGMAAQLAHPKSNFHETEENYSHPRT
jgi:hypothetical protein